jgi:60 kDa SS-A/Ro ribonucleoprotein
MIPTEVQKSPKVWDALLEKMPLMAMIRTLGRMSASGLLVPFSDASSRVIARLVDPEYLQKSRVHPIQILSALLTYKQGHGQKGKLSWTPVPQVVDALNDAFYLAFDNVRPTGKRFYLGIDVSGSMTRGEVAGIEGLTPNMGAAAMAMLIARTETNHFIGGFSARFVDLGITKSMRLDTAMKKCQRDFGGTDCAIAIKHALEKKYPVDAFVVITDGETWAGTEATSQSLQRYRDVTGIATKLIVINMVANRTSLCDPVDGGSLDIVGFDSSVPTLINEFLGAKSEARASDDGE